MLELEFRNNMRLKADKLQSADKAVSSWSDKKYEAYLKDLMANQNKLNAYFDASMEVFEDEEDYLNMLLYFWVVWDVAWTQENGKVAEIDAEHIEKVDQMLLLIMEEAFRSDDHNEKFMIWVDENANSDAIYYFFDLIFEDDTDIDDVHSELITQLFFFTISMIEMYSQTLQK